MLRFQNLLKNGGEGAPIPSPSLGGFIAIWLASLHTVTDDDKASAEGKVLQS